MASTPAAAAPGGVLAGASGHQRCLTNDETREGGAGHGCVTPPLRSAAVVADGTHKTHPGAARGCTHEAGQTDPPFAPPRPSSSEMDAHESASSFTSVLPLTSPVLFTPTPLAVPTPKAILSPTGSKRKRIASTPNGTTSYQEAKATSPSVLQRRKSFLRKGQWTVAEEKFARALIEAFEEGYLPILSGVRLRGYLAVQLQCDPMRISKKLCGGSVDGKEVPRNFGQKKFKLRKKEVWDQGVAARVLAELEQLMHDLWCESGIVRPSDLTLSSTRTAGDDPFFSLRGYVDSYCSSDVSPTGPTRRECFESLSDCTASSSSSSSPVASRPALPIIYLNLAKKHKKDSAARGVSPSDVTPTLQVSDGSREAYKKLAGGAARGWTVDGDSLQAAYELLHLLQAHPDKDAVTE